MKGKVFEVGRENGTPQVQVDWNAEIVENKISLQYLGSSLSENENSLDDVKIRVGEELKTWVTMKKVCYCSNVNLVRSEEGVLCKRGREVWRWHLKYWGAGVEQT